MYAMVNVSQYQIVATGATVAECESNYRQMLLQNGLITDDASPVPVEEETLYTVTGTVAEIRAAVVEGNTHFYLRLSGDDRWFEGSVSDVAVLPLMNVGDKVELVIYAAAGGVAEPIHSATVVTPANKNKANKEMTTAIPAVVILCVNNNFTWPALGCPGRSSAPRWCRWRPR